MLIIVVVLLAILVAGVLVYAATRPDSFRVERATEIAASPQTVFGLVNDFHRWSVWSPWEPLDPTMRKVYSGAQSGPGAVYEWEGNNKVGKGRMEILDATAGATVNVKLDFLRPFEAHNTAEFTMQAAGAGTAVRWAMYGRQPFTLKVMSVFASMDKMVGKDFEKGLANLKRVAEKG